MPLSLISGGTGGTHDRVDRSRVRWIDEVDFMIRAADPLIDTLLKKLRDVAECISEQIYDTPYFIVFTTKASGSVLSVVTDIFLTTLQMYCLKSISTDHFNNEMRHILVFELRDNNDAWIVEQMKLAYKQRLQESLTEHMDISQTLPPMEDE